MRNGDLCTIDYPESAYHGLTVKVVGHDLVSEKYIVKRADMVRFENAVFDESFECILMSSSHLVKFG